MPLNSEPLAGARIWLSGAVPQDASDAQRTQILEFIRRFAQRVFERGGYIVHGSHPTFTPTLLNVAKSYQLSHGRQDCLTLIVSHRWSQDNPLDEWSRVALVYETPEATGEYAEADSLKLLREWTVARCDAIVAVGGNWWLTENDSGVPVELGLAIQRGLPCFLLSGFGGAAATFLERHPDILACLKNGLNEGQNREYSTRSDIGNLAEDVCTHLERLPLVRGELPEGATFRILALDGGGLKGTFTASVLATWEHLTHRGIVEHFDLIAGTSTGGILAIGLGLGLSGQTMLDFYRRRGPEIFPITRLRGRLTHVLRHVMFPKYSQKVLFDKLVEAYYAENIPITLKDSHCRLVIPAYHAEVGVSHVFRTPHHPDLTSNANTQAAYAALATAAAPTFFSAATIATDIAISNYFDGGVWANSPVMAAIIEAVCFLRIPLERIDVLSVGTTEEPFTRWNTRAGIIGWLWKKRILELLMGVQQESSVTLAGHLVGQPRFLRINHMTAPGTYSLDDPSNIEELATIGEQAAQRNNVLGQVKSRFLNGIEAPAWKQYR